MHLYRIENITLKPLLVLAHNHDDAANILEHALVTGMSNRPDADFDVVSVNPEHLYRSPPGEWARDGGRGIVWSTDDDAGWGACRDQHGAPGRKLKCA